MPQSLDNLSVTWTGSTVYTGIKFSALDSGSGASLMMDLRAGAAGTTSVFNVAKNGNTRLLGNGYFWVLDTNANANQLTFLANGVAGAASVTDSGFKANNYQLSASPSASVDITLARDAANTLAQRNGTNAQTTRIYSTYTASDNFQRLAITSASTTLSGLSGASVTATGLIPDGAVVVGVTTRVSTLITGATGYQIGTVADPDRWGDITGTAVGTTSDNTNWTAGTIECFTAASDVVITANGSNFTAGAMVVTVHYLAGQAD